MLVSALHIHKGLCMLSSDVREESLVQQTAPWMLPRCHCTCLPLMRSAGEVCSNATAPQKLACSRNTVCSNATAPQKLACSRITVCSNATAPQKLACSRLESLDLKHAANRLLHFNTC
eukprot:1136222-Pelagomonas_calceolata.AAC.1